MLLAFIATYKKHRRVINNITLLVTVFIIGWQLGRITSPYYASHQIVFSEPNSEQQNITGLVVTPEVKAATTSANAKGEYVGSINSNKYHSIKCSTWQSIKGENQVWFSSPADAEARGYVPTKCTQDLLGEGSTSN